MKTLMLTARRWRHSDLAWSLGRSPEAWISALVLLAYLGMAVLAPLLAPQNPFDLAALDLMDARLPPAWVEGGQLKYLFGTDGQGRDMVSVMLYGLRMSLLVGVASTLLSLVVGVTLGLVAGYVGGRIDNLIMRAADVQLSFPAILVALLIDGLSRTVLPRAVHEQLSLLIVVVAIALANWVQYARTVRGVTMIEKDKDYVNAVRLIGMGRARILFRHVLPNILSPVLVIATLSIGLAVLTEATLSFLGLGVPATSPSLGTLIRLGNEVLFSGEWWITVLPGLLLVGLVLSVNLFGDWLRDALNPRLK
ncbi:peptide/nickel transport system permease protein [Polaromonas sp. YR568]|uniref:ABC transporter permease n=1 Tax=Polaromonas sp. YR568 TaxID=1855301 RepID=UPI0008F3A9A4|nr:peptide/nickel transport system permease protein [Polaromonas sp. YR568]